MPTPAELVASTANFVRENLPDDSAHDWSHTDRVRRLAIYLARFEQADPQIVELAALLHDVADWKFHHGDEAAGPNTARNWLTRNDVEAGIIDAVCDIISRVSFKGASVPTDMPTVEGKCVQDADRLDAIGAIGIARAFSFGSYSRRIMYDPAIDAIQHDSFDAYKSSRGTTVNHFYEKLLLLKDRMQTETGRKLAAKRHQFMEQFLAQFLAEWHSGSDDADHST